ncbi:MAG: nucleotidyltransferase domain-containing protein [archaeon]
MVKKSFKDLRPKSGQMSKESSPKKIQDIPKAQFEKIPTMLIANDRDIALDFATKSYKKFEQAIKAIILFGSSAKQETKPESDIDVIVIIDDVSIMWDEELIATYREELGKIIQANPYIKPLHINTVKLSTWWQDLISGDPVVLNVLRYGEALIDHGGFFIPQKALLQAGKIRPTPEAIYNLLQRVPNHLGRARASLFGAIDGYYWACVDSAHAALMSANLMPPSPEHVAEMMDEHFVKTKMISSKLVDIYSEIHALMKEITYGKVSIITGKKIDELRDNTDLFVDEMAKLSEKLIKV